MALSMSAMVDAIGEGGPAKPDFEQAWQVERVLEAARRSSTERRWVQIDEIQ
jgi:predicted dehydrogenase